MNTRPRILIADDDTALCDLLIDYLATQSLDAFAVHSAEAALDTLSQADNPPDAMVLDVMLPGMTGLDALSQTRAGWEPASYTNLTLPTPYSVYMSLSACTSI